MAERTTRVLVEFAHPFHLDGAEGLQPAGRYEVETLEEQLEGISFVAYRRISTTIALRGQEQAWRSYQLTTIDPADLAEALRIDARTSDANAQV